MIKQLITPLTFQLNLDLGFVGDYFNRYTFDSNLHAAHNVK